VLVISGVPFITVRQHGEREEAVLAAARAEAKAWWVREGNSLQEFYRGMRRHNAYTSGIAMSGTLGAL